MKSNRPYLNNPIRLSKKSPVFYTFHSVAKQFMEQTTDILLEAILDVEELISHGEEQLILGHFSKGTESFDEAQSLLGSTQPDLYFRMGLALFDFGSDDGPEQALLLANKKFKIAANIDPS